MVDFHSITRLIINRQKEWEIARLNVLRGLEPGLTSVEKEEKKKLENHLDVEYNKIFHYYKYNWPKIHPNRKHRLINLSKNLSTT